MHPSKRVRYIDVVHRSCTSTPTPHTTTRLSRAAPKERSVWSEGVLFTVLVGMANRGGRERYDRDVAVSLHAEEGVVGESEGKVGSECASGVVHEIVSEEV
jgi:hypothetical protein